MDSQDLMDMAGCRFLTHHRLDTVTTEGRCDVVLAFLAVLWTAVTFPGIFGIGANNLQFTPEHEGGPQKVLFNLKKNCFLFCCISDYKGKRTVSVLLSSVQLCPGNKPQV